MGARTDDGLDFLKTVQGHVFTRAWLHISVLRRWYTLVYAGFPW